MTKHEYETELKAMQEKRGLFTNAAMWAANCRGLPRALEEKLNELYPLPVWVEPQPVVRGPSGRTFWTVPCDERGWFYLKSLSPNADPQFGESFQFCASDLHAIVLALLDPEGVAEFVDRVLMAAGSWTYNPRSALVATFPRLVALAEKGETR